MMMNDMSHGRLKYGSPYQITMATSISKHKLTNLINLGVLKAKRIDAQTVLIEWESVQRYLDSLPDATYPEAHQPKEITANEAMEAFNDQRVKAMELFTRVK
jgi:hypothetical protein